MLHQRQSVTVMLAWVLAGVFISSVIGQVKGTPSTTTTTTPTTTKTTITTTRTRTTEENRIHKVRAAGVQKNQEQPQSWHVCPSESWRAYNEEEVCIGVYNMSMSWPNASDRCKSLNGSLVRVDSDHKLKFLQELVDNQTSFWIGAIAFITHGINHVIRTIDNDTSHRVECFALHHNDIGFGFCYEEKNSICQRNFLAPDYWYDIPTGQMKVTSNSEPYGYGFIGGCVGIVLCVATIYLILAFRKKDTSEHMEECTHTEKDTPYDLTMSPFETEAQIDDQSETTSQVDDVVNPSTLDSAVISNPIT